MSTHVVDQMERSVERIDDGDLAKLCEIAIEDSEDFFSRHRQYKSPTVCIALCQGAALHYIDGQSGVKDFDVWTFYAKTDAPAFPVRRRGRRDFGKSKFGKNPDDVGFAGRRVDLLGRSIEALPDPIASIQAYLRQVRTKTTMELSRKAVVLLYPPHVRGKVAWPIPARSEGEQ